MFKKIHIKNIKKSILENIPYQEYIIFEKILKKINVEEIFKKLKNYY